jgi:hypothetical protein
MGLQSVMFMQGLLFAVVFFVLPPLVVLGARRSSESPWLWALATLFTSWIGVLAFLIATEPRRLRG